MSNFKRHVKKDKVKWIIVSVAIFLVVCFMAGLSIKIARQTTTTSIGWESYEIGVINDTGKNTSGDTSIRLKNEITVDGLSIKLDDEAEITYKLFFFDKDGNFISSTSELADDYDSSLIPESAETVRIMITPTADEDGKVSLIELSGYSNQLTVRVDK